MLSKPESQGGLQGLRLTAPASASTRAAFARPAARSQQFGHFQCPHLYTYRKTSIGDAQFAK